MIKNVKISSTQLAFLIIGFTFGDAAILNPATAAKQDAWIVNILALVGGLILISIYTSISIIYPGKTLIAILKDTFGKFIGNIIAVLYLWYFIHLLSLILGNFTEFMISTIYPETPILFIGITLMLISIYAVKKGLEVIARISELLVPILIFTVVFLFFALISKYDPYNFMPVLEYGFQPVLKASFHMMTFPFGETVVLLMIFPHLNKKEKTFRVSFFSIVFIGFILALITTRDLMVLGPDMLTRTTYPNYISTKLMPSIDIEAFIATNLLIGGGIKICIFLYAISIAITQLFSLDDYKPFVIPISVLSIALSVWLFNNVFENFAWEAEIYPYYAIPFQIIIPLLILILSFMKKKKKAA